MPAQDTTYVVLADVIDSRDIADRAGFRSRLDGALDAVNDRHADALVAPFEPIKGIDEFGAVLGHLGALVDMLDEMLHAIHPVRIRLAIASGGFDVGSPEAGIASMDGPGFHRADRLADSIEREGLYVGIDTDAPADPILESAINLLLLHWETRTDRQREVVEAYERHGTQTAAAEALGVTHQTISETLRRIDYHRLATIRDRLRSACEAYYD